MPSSSWFNSVVGVSASAGSKSSPREVLVIDDDAGTRDTIAFALQQLGWTPRVAKSGEEAKAVMAAFADTVGLALVDVVLPDIDGLTLARYLHGAHPKLKIVILSGRLVHESRWIVSEEGFKFLAKPCSLRDLRDAVAEMLGEGESPASV